jgi:hypothetical protein
MDKKLGLPERLPDKPEELPEDTKEKNVVKIGKKKARLPMPQAGATA